MKKIFGFAAVAFLSLTLLAGPSFAMGSADRDQGPAERAGESIDEAGRAVGDAVTPEENEGVDLDVHGDPITPREGEGIDLDVHTENEGRANLLLADAAKRDTDEGPAETVGRNIDEAGRAVGDAILPKENEGVDLDVHGDPITPKEGEGIDLDVHTEKEGKANLMLLADSGKGKYGSDDYDKDYDKSRKGHDKYDKDYDKSKDRDKYDKDYDKSKDYDRDYDKSDSYGKEHYDRDDSYKEY
jgi:hypothetical protein